MQDISIGMPHAVFHADAVPLVFQRTDGLTQLLLVFVYHGFGHHVEARLHQLFLCSAALLTLRIWEPSMVWHSTPQSKAVKMFSII